MIRIISSIKDPLVIHGVTLFRSVMLSLNDPPLLNVCFQNLLKTYTFNVLSLPDPNTTADIMEREIGGLGVYLIRRLTDDASYQRKDGRNILRMVLHTRNEETLS